MHVGEAGFVDDEIVVINQIHEDGRITIHDGQGSDFRTIPAEEFDEV